MAADKPHEKFMTSLINRLEKLMAEQEISPSALSLAIGGGREAVRMILTGRSKNPRSDTLTKLARELGVSLQYLLGETDEKGQAPSLSMQLSEGPGLLIRHRVQAGAYYPVYEADESIGTCNLPINNRFPADQQWGEEVVGDSIDLIYPHGSVLHVVSLAGSGYMPRNGQLVIVAHQKDGGLMERTVKRVFRQNDQYELIGMSSNPKWNTPIPMPDRESEHETIAIVGLVIGGYRAEQF
jgi:transcriptional regulator with XRE-family HTH domain